jgi:hypothetical protein
MRERKLRQLDRTVCRLERLVDSIPEQLSKNENDTLRNLRQRTEKLWLTTKHSIKLQPHLEEENT